MTTEATPQEREIQTAARLLHAALIDEFGERARKPLEIRAFEEGDGFYSVPYLFGYGVKHSRDHAIRQLVEAAHVQKVKRFLRLRSFPDHSRLVVRYGSAQADVSPGSNPSVIRLTWYGRGRR